MVKEMLWPLQLVVIWQKAQEASNYCQMVVIKSEHAGEAEGSWGHAPKKVAL